MTNIILIIVLLLFIIVCFSWYLYHEKKISGNTIDNLLWGAPTSYDPFIIIDSKGYVVSWNSAATVLFGWSTEEVIGLPIVDIIIPDRYRENHRRGIKIAATTGTGPIIGKEIEISALKKSGKEFPVRLRVLSSIT